MVTTLTGLFQVIGIAIALLMALAAAIVAGEVE